MQVLQPAAQASLLGRSERVDMASAALINGISSHTFDFDDTHLKTIIHPAGPVASAVLALAEHSGASGRELIDALVLGIDVSCRVGNAMYPDHYDRGWHITGSTGTLGAAAACARLLGLDAQQTAMALGIAASQPIGMREQFGTMTKPFHPGRRARAGLMSALLAQQGYTASPRALEAPRGMMQTVSTKNDWREITDELGQRFEITLQHLQALCLRHRHPPQHRRLRAAARPGRDARNRSSASSCKVHSLVLELTGKKEPADGLQAKFSVYHGCAAGLTLRPRRPKTSTPTTSSTAPTWWRCAARSWPRSTTRIDEASADVTAVLTDGRRVHVFVEHAIGSLANPMSDAQLEAKFRGMADAVLGAERCSALIKACWAVGNAADLRALARAGRPGLSLN